MAVAGFYLEESICQNTQTLEQFFQPLTLKECSTNNLQILTCPSVNWLNCCCPCWTSVCVICKGKRRMITEGILERARTPPKIFCRGLSRAFTLPNFVPPPRGKIHLMPLDCGHAAANCKSRTGDMGFSCSKPNTSMSSLIGTRRMRPPGSQKAAALPSPEGREESLRDQPHQDHEVTCW